MSFGSQCTLCRYSPPQGLSTLAGITTPTPPVQPSGVKAECVPPTTPPAPAPVSRGGSIPLHRTFLGVGHHLNIHSPTLITMHFCVWIPHSSPQMYPSTVLHVRPA
ncbi:hypothetical protein MSAN_00628300 [Mycena sanguinolenta]|uniref:Uncharacterized protein n=1 Tax=Mycena sanguinolenta TaxID=230812 RepID=A0A8H7DC31_9AGAR|nr:hypothetical protein MSAN_00628300 [Mycena sanguinolenta]